MAIPVSAPFQPVGADQTLTVLIAGDHVLVLDGIKLLVNNILGPVRFLEAGDGHSLVRVVQVQPKN